MIDGYNDIQVDDTVKPTSWKKLEIRYEVR